MSFCPNCGIELRESSNFCPKCGCEIKKYAVQSNFSPQSGNENPSLEDYNIQNKYENKNFQYSNNIGSLNPDKSYLAKDYKRNYFLILLFVGAIACLFVGAISVYSSNSTNTNVVASSMMLLGLSTLLFLLIWFVSLIAIYFDAKNIGSGKNPDNKNDSVGGPGGWFIAALFLWIVFFPLYLYQRKGIWENNLGYN